MKVLSFLGTTNYAETTYVFREQEYRTALFPEALYEFFQPTDLLVFVTQEARDKHFDTLRQRLDGRIEPQPVDIPLGRSQRELWSIFDRLTENIDEGDTVIFDITNAFRSIPLLIFIAIAYLRSAQSIDLQAITYGAFEAREAGRTPVFDLSPFIVLLDWTTATDKFLKTGNAQELVAQLQEAHRMPYVSGQDDQDELPRRLQNVATAIQDVSQAMRLIRAYETMTTACTLIERLDQARHEVERWAKPFGVLLDQTRRAYAQFNLDDPETELKENLKIQLVLLRWYLEREQPAQAITLAREWVVSLVTYRLKWDMIRDRHTVEGVLNMGVDSLRRRQPLPMPVRELEGSEEIVKVWNRLHDLRNDVAHAGMRLQPRPTSAILKDTDELYERLATLVVDDF